MAPPALASAVALAEACRVGHHRYSYLSQWSSYGEGLPHLRTSHWKYFVALLALSFSMFSLAALFLPLVLIRPQKVGHRLLHPDCHRRLLFHHLLHCHHRHHLHRLLHLLHLLHPPPPSTSSTFPTTPTTSSTSSTT